jgi:hypothetical protein
MRVANWNIEWMNNWFVGGDDVEFRESYAPRGKPGDAIADVDSLCRRVASVILSLDPDALCVQEGPSDIREMELFISTYLQDDGGSTLYRAFGGHVPGGGGAQKNYILVKNGGALSNPVELDDARLEDLIGEWQADVEGIAQLQPYSFTRRPIVLDCEYLSQTFRLIALHLKSKYIHDGESLWTNPQTQPEFIQEALIHRRRISAEAMRVRNYIDVLLFADPQMPIIVAGDLNDGPGVDLFEQYFLTHNLTDILLGSTYDPRFLFEHSFLWSVPEAERSTARFNDFIEGVDDLGVVLDHILVSPILRSGTGVPFSLISGRIAHAEFDRAIDHAAASSRESNPSDHRPVLAIFGP